MIYFLSFIYQGLLQVVLELFLGKELGEKIFFL
jgi:hypothetical protein